MVRWNVNGSGENGGFDPLCNTRVGAELKLTVAQDADPPDDRVSGRVVLTPAIRCAVNHEVSMKTRRLIAALLLISTRAATAQTTATAPATAGRAAPRCRRPRAIRLRRDL